MVLRWSRWRPASELKGRRPAERVFWAANSMSFCREGPLSAGATCRVRRGSASAMGAASSSEKVTAPAAPLPVAAEMEYPMYVMPLNYFLMIDLLQPHQVPRAMRAVLSRMIFVISSRVWGSD